MKVIKQIKLNPKEVWSVLFHKKKEYKPTKSILVKLEDNQLCIYISFETPQKE